MTLTVSLGNVNSPVIGILRDIASYIADRRFDELTRDGNAAGVIVVDESGSSWGYGPYLRRIGAETGDVINVDFDLADGRAVLSFGDEVTLDSAD